MEKKFINAQPKIRIREYFVKKSVGPKWFNYSWEQTIKQEILGVDLHITVDSSYDNVYINGKKITNK